MKIVAICIAAVAGLATLLAPPSQSAAQGLAAAVLPDTPAGKRFADWLAVYNRGDEAELKAYVRDVMSATKWQSDTLVEVRSTTGPLVPFKVIAPGPNIISVILAERDTDSFDEFAMLVEPGDPHRITLLQPHPVPRPTDAPPLPVLDEAQLLTALKVRLDRETAAGLFSGVLLLARHGKPIFQYAGGQENRERRIPMTVNSQLGTASIGKMFTTVAVMQLAQSGKLDLDAPVGRYLPDYPNKSVATRVTVNELLTHTGGTGDFPDGAAPQGKPLLTPADYIALSGARDPLFEPGSRKSYSNFGFIILGRIVERVSGQPWGDYLRDHVFAPAGMTQSGTAPYATPAPHRATGYTLTAGKLVSTDPMKSLRAPTPAGGEYTSAGDLLKFMTALMAGRLLDQAHTELLLHGDATIAGRRYPYDISGKAENGKPFFGHQGGGPGANGDVRAFPDSGYTLVILSNFGPPWQKFAQFVSNRLPMAR
ncbi:serine hydrolase domain-containing protein [Phenylobacterium sp.]|jgi:CubicO group peptidase (beta-lactamase class C family)|uniref:serine hydrolase domain-containing protein n=1 Tax=Phenylobacterium sp. TaxID=1871053 RepID=UPI002F3FA27B